MHQQLLSRLKISVSSPQNTQVTELSTSLILFLFYHAFLHVIYFFNWLLKQASSLTSTHTYILPRKLKAFVAVTSSVGVTSVT